MNRITNLKAKAMRPGQLLLTLLHLLSMRTPDILSSVPRQRAGAALARLRPGGTAGRSRVKLMRGKCIENPLDCALCMHGCPEGVFFTYPRERRHGQVCNSYELVTAFKSRCTGCGTCVDVCPHEALRLG